LVLLLLVSKFLEAINAVPTGALVLQGDEPVALHALRLFHRWLLG
jgi:hypothetical protein